MIKTAITLCAAAFAAGTAFAGNGDPHNVNLINGNTLLVDMHGNVVRNGYVALGYMDDMGVFQAVGFTTAEQPDVEQTYAQFAVPEAYDPTTNGGWVDEAGAGWNFTFDPGSAAFAGKEIVLFIGDGTGPRPDSSYFGLYTFMSSPNLEGNGATLTWNDLPGGALDESNLWMGLPTDSVFDPELGLSPVGGSIVGSVTNENGQTVFTLVPEPAGATLALAGFALLLGRRRRS